MLQSVFPFILPFLFEEEKVPVFLSNSTFLSEHSDELQSILADFHYLLDYLYLLRRDEQDYLDIPYFLDNSDQDSISS